MQFWSRLVRALSGGQKPARIGRLTYAIGDIHGRADLLEALLAKIERDRAGAPAELIFLGDYVDRGPASKGVIDRLLEIPPAGGIAPVFLKGNHEAVMLEFLENPGAGQSWAKWGGDEAMMSYGVKPPLSKTELEPWDLARRALVEAIPPAHMDFLRSLALTAVREDYLFVHAGIDPDTPLQKQGEQEFLWIREPFLSSRRALPYTVVHGHTPAARPHRDSRRINCDTGAYLSGVLTAVRLDGERVSFLHT